MTAKSLMITSWEYIKPVPFAYSLLFSRAFIPVRLPWRG
jgi:hypothetical protein